MKDFLKVFGGGSPAPIGRRFEKKVAVVTGASAGIGFSTAIAFAREGATVAMLARREEEGRKALEKVQKESPDSIFIAANVRETADVQRAFAEIKQKFGRVDVAFNNAGGIHRGKKMAEVEEAEFDRVVETNLKGTWLCMREEIGLMRNGGAIVNNSSIWGVRPNPEYCGYVASKWAVIGLTKTAALEYVSQGIRINVVCPGWVTTDMTSMVKEESLKHRVPMGRWIQPEEIAECVLYLCSDMGASFIGEAIVLDGGATLR